MDLLLEPTCGLRQLCAMYPSARSGSLSRRCGWPAPCLHRSESSVSTLIDRSSTSSSGAGHHLVECKRNVFAWTALISQYAKSGQARQALRVYEEMRRDGVTPNPHTFVAVLKACSSLKDLECARRIHEQVVECGVEGDLYVSTMLVDMYAKCNSLVEARDVFDKMPQRDVASWNAMILGYAQANKVDDALSLYHRMQEQQEEGGVTPDERTFGSVLKACSALAGLEKETDSSRSSKEFGKHVLKERRCLDMVRSIHADAKKFEFNVFLGNMLVDVYAKCGSLEDARAVFDNMPCRTVVTWTAMIQGLAQRNKGKDALRLFEQMQEQGVVPNDRTYVAALKACCSLTTTVVVEEGEEEGSTSKDDDVVGVRGRRCLDTVRSIHADIVRKKLDKDVFLGTTLVDVYAKCRSLEDARRVFDTMPRRDVVCWNAMISGYAQLDKGDDALQLYARMEREGIVPNKVTYVTALKACSCLVASSGGEGVSSVKQRCLKSVAAIHKSLAKRRFESDMSVANMLVDVYAKCGSLEDARRVFDNMPRKDVISWTAMIFGYAQMNEGDEGLQLFARMKQEGMVPDGRTYVSALKACCSSLGVESDHCVLEADGLKKRCVEMIEMIHSEIVKAKLESDVFVGNMLVDAYAKCGCPEDARQVFEMMPQRSVVSWTTMISGYSQMDRGEEALQLFDRMQQEGVAPNVRTYVSVLKACSSLAELVERNGAAQGVGVRRRCLKLVRAIHADVVKGRFETDVYVGTMLVDVYAKCRSLEDARSVFEWMPRRTVVSWTCMILGYLEMGQGNIALQLYNRMQHEGVVPDKRTFVGALNACGRVAGLEQGKKIHAQILGGGIENMDLHVMHSLIDMYGKCGSMVDAQEVFDALPTKGGVAWNALMTGYARQGESDVVFHLFEQMKQDGIQPSSVTFLAVLTACSHAGLLDRGQQHFEAMSRDYGIVPTIEHFTCVIDLVGRVGQVDRAMEIVNTMPVQPDSAVWKCVLGACNKWNNVVIGKQAFECALRLDKNDAAAYVSMSNIYAAVDMQTEAKEIQARRLTSGAWKEPGWSQWTDMEGNAHVFVAGDQEHASSAAVYTSLETILKEMTADMCVPAG